jgi:hypothetical protein
MFPAQPDRLADPQGLDRLARLPGAGAPHHGCAVGFLLRSMDRQSLVGQVVGVALGILQQPLIDEVVNRGLNRVEIVEQEACKITGIDPALCVSLVDDFVLNLGERHPKEFRR